MLIFTVFNQKARKLRSFLKNLLFSRLRSKPIRLKPVTDTSNNLLIKGIKVFSTTKGSRPIKRLKNSRHHWS
jgi:hypothetical protein